METSTGVRTVSPLQMGAQLGHLAPFHIMKVYNELVKFPEFVSLGLTGAGNGRIV